MTICDESRLYHLMIFDCQLLSQLGELRLHISLRHLCGRRRDDHAFVKLLTIGSRSSTNCSMRAMLRVWKKTTKAPSTSQVRPLLMQEQAVSGVQACTTVERVAKVGAQKHQDVTTSRHCVVIKCKADDAHARGQLVHLVHPRQGCLLQGMHTAQHGLTVRLTALATSSAHAGPYCSSACVACVRRVRIALLDGGMTCSVGFTRVLRGLQPT